MSGTWLCPGCGTPIPDDVTWENGESPCDCPPMRTICIEVPMVPDACLFPNNRINTHWRKQHPHIVELRTAGKYAAMNATTNPELRIFAPIDVTYIVHWPRGRRRPDVDALPTACKPALDGVVDAGVIPGDGPDTIVRVSASQGKTKGEGVTEIILCGRAREERE